MLGLMGVWLALVGLLGSPATDRLAVVAIAVSCLVLAVGLAGRKVWVSRAAVGTFAAGAFVLGVVFGALPLAAAAVLGLAILLLTTRRYDAGTSRTAVIAAMASLAIGLAFVTAELSFPAALAIAGGCLLLLRAVPDERTEDERTRARGILTARGTGSLQPYRLLPPASAVANQAGDAAFAFARAGRTAVVLGDPSGESSVAWSAFGEWAGRVRRLGWRPVVYQAGQDGRDRLATMGWHGVLVGMEAVLDPSAFRLRSPRVANVRHTVTRSQKGGVTVAWSPRGLRDVPGGVALRHGMAAVDKVWRSQAGLPLGFTVGQFAEERIQDAGVAAATGADGSVIAFVLLRPTAADGSTWMLDLIRRLPGSVPGAVEACLVGAIEGLGAEGVRELSLGLAPLHGLDAGEGPAAQRLLAVGAKLVGPFYDYPGLAFFKRKFDPQWQPRYLLVPSRADFLPAAIALLRLHLGGSWAAIIRSIGAGLAPRRTRRRILFWHAAPTLAPGLVASAVNGLGEPELSATQGHPHPSHGQDEEP